MSVPACDRRFLCFVKGLLFLVLCNISYLVFEDTLLSPGIRTPHSLPSCGLLPLRSPAPAQSVPPVPSPVTSVSSLCSPCAVCGCVSLPTSKAPQVKSTVFGRGQYRCWWLPPEPLIQTASRSALRPFALGRYTCNDVFAFP